MPSPIAEMFEHNIWANLRLLDFCEKLTDEQLDQRTEGTFGTIRETLIHSIGSENGYILNITGQPGVERLPEDRVRTLGELRERAKVTGERLKQIASELDESEVLTLKSRDIPYTIPASALLVQAINHGTEHRAQILVGLTQLGIEPPTLDGWTYAIDVGQIGSP